MIEFMVLGLPRSGTTWAANWLTTDTTICYHDPLYRWHYTELDIIQTNKVVGISCTGLYHFADWVNDHPSRKVILHRDLSDINASMASIGLPCLSEKDEEKLYSIDGIHIDWLDVFERPKSTYEFLTGKPFDAERHSELINIEMQPQFAGLTVNRNVTKRLIDEIRSI